MPGSGTSSTSTAWFSPSPRRSCRWCMPRGPRPGYRGGARSASGPPPTSRGRRAEGPRLRRLVVPGHLDEPGERALVADRQVGQDLAIDLDARLAQAEHEPVVGQAALPRGRVDARDPEPAEVPLALAPVAERVRQRVQQRLVGGTEQQLPRVAEAPGPLQDRAVLAVGDDATLDPSHGYTPSERRTCRTSAAATCWAARKARLRLAVFFSRRWLFQACFRISFPVRVTRIRSLRPLRVLSLGTL